MVRSAAPLAPVYPTVVHMLAAAAEEAPSAEALAFDARRLNYRDYAACVAGFAAELARVGAGTGTRVATVLSNSIEACIAAFAIHASGAQSVPLNPLYTPRELDHILKDAAPVALIVDASLGPTLKAVAEAAGIGHVIMVGEGGRRLDAWRGGDPKLPLPDPESLALLQYTGGTTGRPKGVNLIHHAISTNVAQREGLLPTGRSCERILCMMPLFHSYAMAMGLFLAAYCRGSLVIRPRYKPDDALRMVAAERITIFPGSPTVFIGLMAHPDFARTDWSSVHTCYSGSAPLSEETLRRWRDAVGAPVFEGYGQTEAGPVLTYIPARGTARPGSVGIPLAETEVEIVDVETGTKLLAAGERGEIRARGPQIMQGYRNLPRETADALRNGWLYTGDIGEIDADGYLYIRDRKKDMAIVGGYNVYPREIDEVLFLHPDVADAAAVGAPDDYRGEVVRAYVVLRPSGRATAEDLLAHCRANLAKYKVPASIDILDALPKTTVNKTDKKVLRERARAASPAA
ncbi:MAG: AMP-binding protein [Alphaproteobacteria bacterium]|nr:AMP-binding protein [Alphaproteobacteria bacterium]